MEIKDIGHVQPQNAEMHGLFGAKYLKHHKMRDELWTANDLVEQYERLCAIFEKDNEVKKLQRERAETQQAELYKKLKKEKKDKDEILQGVLNGDIQRTKNVLINFPIYMKTYYNKHSYQVLEELMLKSFNMRKTLDSLMGERERLMIEYEKRLLQIAKKQELIRYYDIKEFQQERKTKQLLVQMKNSETRFLATESINRTYKTIIDQLLHDSLYYAPVLRAINGDWNEQTRLVQQTFNIGHPAIDHAKKMERDVKELAKITKLEEKKRFEEITINRQVLKEHPKLVKQLVRRDSDFMQLGNRYVRDTRSMTFLRRGVDDLDWPIKKLKMATLAHKSREIVPKARLMLQTKHEWLNRVDRRYKQYQSLLNQKTLNDFIRGMLLDDYPKVFNEEFIAEIALLQKAVDVERGKQMITNGQMTERTKVLETMIFALHHILDVVRHVGTRDIYMERKYPEGNLQLPLLRFNKAKPKEAKLLQSNLSKLLPIIRSKVQLLMHYYNKKKANEDDINIALAKYQQAVVEDSATIFRPPTNVDYD